VNIVYHVIVRYEVTPIIDNEAGSGGDNHFSVRRLWAGRGLWRAHGDMCILFSLWGHPDGECILN
jgi:hypothetical protein